MGKHTFSTHRIPNTTLRTASTYAKNSVEKYASENAIRENTNDRGHMRNTKQMGEPKTTTRNKNTNGSSRKPQRETIWEYQKNYAPLKQKTHRSKLKMGNTQNAKQAMTQWAKWLKENFQITAHPDNPTTQHT